MIFSTQAPGVDPGFQVRGRTWKNWAVRREVRKYLGYLVWKITILRKKKSFFPILGGREPGAPPGSAPGHYTSADDTIGEQVPWEKTTIE